MRARKKTTQPIQLEKLFKWRKLLRETKFLIATNYGHGNFLIFSEMLPHQCVCVGVGVGIAVVVVLRSASQYWHLID